MQKFVLAFPLWAVLLSLLAWYQPSLFNEQKAAIVPLLAVIMFGMGLSLRWSDFVRVFRSPAVIGLGVLLQYLLMPFLAWLIALVLELDPVMTTGMILVGASPGGTASNVICYLARGDVALSISMTAVSTVLAVLLTPLLVRLYVDASIDVPVQAMLVSILKIVIAPVVLGVVLNQLLHRHLHAVRHLFPLISVAAIVWIIAIIVALSAPRFAELGLVLAAAVILHNLLGLAGGYSLSRLLGYSPKTARTLAIEVGMQNSGLAVALAVKFFTPLAALPGAVFSIWHNISGSLLASWWSRRSQGEAGDTDKRNKPSVSESLVK